jgi:hypothetical protein
MLDAIFKYVDNFAIYKYIILIAFVAVLMMQPVKTTKLPSLVVFLLIINFTELFLTYYWIEMYGNNVIIYNLFSTLCVCYYLMVYLYHFHNRPWIKYLYLVSGIWFVFSIWMIYDNFNKMVINALSYNLGLMIVIGLIIKYFYDIIYIEEYRSIGRDPLFYFSLGISLFYVSSFPILNFMNVVILSEGTMSIFATLLKIGNVFLSLGYLGAVLCYKKI